jgi:signal transduction histidine kinase
MKMRYLFILLIFSSLWCNAQQTNDKAYHYLKRSLESKIKESDSLYAIGLYRPAFYRMRDASTLAGRLRNEVLMQQQKNFLLDVALEKKMLDNKSFAWKNDSLQLRLRLDELNERKLKIQNDSVIREQKLKNIANANDLTNYNIKLKQAQISMAKKKFEKQKQKDAMLNFLYWLTCVSAILLLAVLYYYIRRNEVFISNLKKRHQALNAARKKTLAARDKAQQARQESQKANMMKTVFIQNMSHEMRTPLNAIVGFANLLTDSSMPFDMKQRQEFTSLISKNSDLLITLIDDILDFSDLSSGKYKTKYTKATLADICDVAFTAVISRCPKDVEMNFYTPSSVQDNLTLWTDSGRVIQVLINYLTNACKNTVQGNIKLTYVVNRNADDNRAETVCFSVTDTGSGVPGDKAESIFKRFEKLDDFKQGNGFGLNICRTIAELLQGRCWLDTSYTDGARFCFEIPVHTEKPKA